MNSPRVYDVVILGSGIAGIICARELIRIGVKRVLVVEASDVRVVTDRSKAHYKGQVSMRSERHSNPDEYRCLSIGGTSKAWGGGLVFFEPQDFESCGPNNEKYWPLSFNELDKYRNLAANNFGLSSDAVNREVLRSQNQGFHQIGFSSEFDTSAVVFKRWGKYNFVGELGNIDHLVGSIAIDLEDRAGGDLSVVVKDYKFGNLRRVFGKKIVIATGGMESTRFFLNSKYLMAKTTNNRSAGRFYSPHISGSLGILIAKNRYRDVFSNRTNVTREANYASFIYSKTNDGSPELKLNFSNVDASCNLEMIMGNIENRRIRLHQLASSRHIRHVRFDSDQTPNKESRIMLSESLGPDGLPTIEIDHRILTEDWTRIMQLAERFRIAAAEFGCGFLLNDLSFVKNSIRGQSHHMGTLRMSKEYGSGIVDSNLEVFGAPNVFVLSSAVFPSYSFANPTFLIGALACRLANFLSEK
jgi:hypothetical protein